MEQLNAAGTSFVSVTQNFSTADAMGRLTMNLLASFAEFEWEMVRERTSGRSCVRGAGKVSGTCGRQCVLRWPRAVTG